MEINLIVAADINWGIGQNNKIPWQNLPIFKEDIAIFKATTVGNAIVMGHNTYDAIGRVLPERLNIVLSRHQTRDNNNNAVLFCNNLIAAVKSAKNSFVNCCYIIGGSSVYEQALDLHNLSFRKDFLSKIYLSRINSIFDCDKFFPKDKLKDELWTQSLTHTNANMSRYLYTAKNT